MNLSVRETLPRCLPGLGGALSGPEAGRPGVDLGLIATGFLSPALPFALLPVSGLRLGYSPAAAVAGCLGLGGPPLGRGGAGRVGGGRSGGVFFFSS